MFKKTFLNKFGGDKKKWTQNFFYWSHIHYIVLQTKKQHKVQINIGNFEFNTLLLLTKMQMQNVPKNLGRALPSPH